MRNRYGGRRMVGLSRFGLRKLRRLADSNMSEGEEAFEHLPQRVPVADGAEGLERNDQLPQGDFRSRFEHLSRYSRVCQSRRERVVDIGCGTGYGTFMLSRCGHAVGIDVSRQALQYAKRRHPSCEFVRGDAGALLLKGDAFDGVTAFEIIEHLHDPAPLLRECHRILKKDGILLLSSPNLVHIGNILRKILFRKEIPLKVDSKNPYHIREFPCHEMVFAIESHGFRLEWSVGQTLPIDRVISRLNFIVRRPPECLGLSDVYDWALSEMGRQFPRLSWTVVYGARRE